MANKINCSSYSSRWQDCIKPINSKHTKIRKSKRACRMNMSSFQHTQTTWSSYYTCLMWLTPRGCQGTQVDTQWCFLGQQINYSPCHFQFTAPPKLITWNVVSVHFNKFWVDPMNQYKQNLHPYPEHQKSNKKSNRYQIIQSLVNQSNFQLRNCETTED